jgi:hypothetical protein
MPRQKSLITVIRDLVRQEITKAISSLLGNTKKTAAPARRRRRRRRRGPGRPPGRPPGSKNKRRAASV